eukprot:1822328-Pyramimonas_sp.AAC.1
MLPPSKNLLLPDGKLREGAGEIPEPRHPRTKPSEIIDNHIEPGVLGFRSSPNKPKESPRSITIQPTK